MAGDDLKHLLERVEKATGAEREIDGDMVLAFGGPPEDAMPFKSDVAWTYRGAGEWVTPSPRSIGLDIIWRCPAYTASIDAALGLVDRKLPGWLWQLHFAPPRGHERQHYAFLGSPQADGPTFHGWGAATPLALLAALLRALISQEEK